jgi:ComF family protein
MISLTSLSEDILHFFFPHICQGCGDDDILNEQLLCENCIRSLPATGFEHLPGNTVEKMFYGRLQLESAFSKYYFNKGKILQHLIHLLKYKNNQEMGLLLGEMMGLELSNSIRIPKIDFLISLPMFSDKEKARGYNQAHLLCKGIERTTGIPVLNQAIGRNRPTETQTRKHRTERWTNVSDSFEWQNRFSIEGKHVLLVDDVITTGATLEACGEVLISKAKVKLSIATLAIAVK